MSSKTSMAKAAKAARAVALACALAAGLPLIAPAADQTVPVTPSGVSISFDALDVNKDGRVSLPEASADASLVEGFSTADKNGDGYLDNAEYDRAVRKEKKRN
jgi:hypothetical protein